jgi:hypothetical protein
VRLLVFFSLLTQLLSSHVNAATILSEGSICPKKASIAQETLVFASVEQFMANHLIAWCSMRLLGMFL